MDSPILWDGTGERRRREEGLDIKLPEGVKEDGNEI
jgi:hypothetical protein